ncbi:MAG: MgtC/SapB family protein [Acidobacteriaceae bacterium]|nr:MgtC/SapB family protein [Acidobacteriaceae bacterium]MBV9499636.1 MgtC/SapB family protein [Acidobacteriaceae bacterium]
MHLDPILYATLLRLAIALALGSVIGIERQWRQRAAGLRTNTLVCLGAAAFVDLGSTLASPTSIVAYVVSGVGFLGAGAIIKEGGGIRGLNTAATLWCSAAVGACAGAGALITSVYVTALLMVINLAFRPLSRFIDRRSLKPDVNIIYRLTATCSDTHESEVRHTLLTALAERPVVLRALRTEDMEEDHEIRLRAEIESPTRDETLLEQILQRLRKDPTVSSVEFGEGTLDVE